VGQLLLMLVMLQRVGRGLNLLLVGQEEPRCLSFCSWNFLLIAWLL
jgi:hypothetical protein